MLRGGKEGNCLWVPLFCKSKGASLFAINMLPMAQNEIFPRGSELLDTALIGTYILDNLKKIFISV